MHPFVVICDEACMHAQRATDIRTSDECACIRFNIKFVNGPSIAWSSYGDPAQHPEQCSRGRAAALRILLYTIL